jgi:hypothetical protein
MRECTRFQCTLVKSEAAIAKQRVIERSAAPRELFRFGPTHPDKPSVQITPEKWSRL